MRIICISDTHGQHHSLGTLLECDVLVHTGDAVTQFSPNADPKPNDFEDFLEWFGAQPAQHKLFVAGNHDFGLFFANSRKRYEAMMPDGVTYLRDQEIVIDGLKFYGTPWQPHFCDMAFNIRDHKERSSKYALIPEDTNVLLTHCPPKQIGDRFPPSKEYQRAYPRKQWQYGGCGALAKRIQELEELRLHSFGHIHYAAGYSEIKGTYFVNAALSGESPYEIVNEPTIVDLFEHGTLIS